MTLKDLQNEVAALGFERSINLDNTFLGAAGRALHIIFADQRIKRTVRILVAKSERTSHTPTVRSDGISDITLPLVGRAYSMRLVGRGRWTLRDKDETFIEDFDTDDTLVRGFLKEGGSITFSGGPFAVYDLTTYAQLYGSTVSDIPDGSGKRSFDIKEFGDFHSFASYATDKYGVPIPSAKLSEGVLTLDEDYDGEAVVTYYRLPAPLCPDTPDAPIDIPRYAESQLVLLTASLFWLDDNKEASEYYDKLYKKLAEQSRTEFDGRDGLPEEKPTDSEEPIHSYSAAYGDTNGWT